VRVKVAAGGELEFVGSRGDNDLVSGQEEVRIRLRDMGKTHPRVNNNKKPKFKETFNLITTPVKPRIIFPDYFQFIFIGLRHC